LFELEDDDECMLAVAGAVETGPAVVVVLIVPDLRSLLV
jgi:hypothetical protein